MTTEAPAPAVDSINVHANSSSALSSLESLLNPASQQALDSVVVQPAPTPSHSQEAAPATTQETAKQETSTEVKSQEPLKRGFDALESKEAKKTEEAQAESDDAPPDATTPQAKNAWSAIRAKVKEYEAREAQWTAEREKLASEAAKVKQFTEADPEWKNYQEAKAKIEEWKPVIARTAYQASDEYKQMVAEPFQAVGDSAWKLAESQKLPHEKVEAYLREGDRARQYEMLEELTAEVPGWVKDDLRDYAAEVRRISNVKDHLERNAIAAAKEHETMETQRREKESIERKAAEMRAVSDSKPKLLKASSLFKLEGETDEAAVDSILKMAQETPFDEQSVDEKTFAVISAGLVPRMSRVISQYQQKVESLEAQIASLASAAPRTGAAQAGSQVQQMPSDLVSALSNALTGAGINL